MNQLIQNFSQQEYLSIFIAFIYGHITANLFGGWAGWMQNRKSIIFSIDHILFSILLLLLTIDVWWVAYFRVSMMTTGILYFVLALLTPLTLFIISTIVMPRIKTQGTINLKDYFIRKERLIYSLLGLNFLLNVFEVPFLERGMNTAEENYFRVTAFVLCGLAIVYNMRWISRALLLVGFTVLILHMVLMEPAADTGAVGFSFVEYLTIYTTFVYGFVASMFFRGWSLIIQRANEISFSKEHLIWSLLAFLYLIDVWWGSWTREQYISSNLGYFCLFLLTPLAFCLLASGLFPIMKNTEFNLKEYFEANRRYIFSLIGLVVTSNLIVANAMEEVSLFSNENYFRLGALVLVALMVAVNKVLVQRLILFIGFTILILHSIFFG